MRSVHPGQPSADPMLPARRSPLRTFEESRFFSFTLLLPILIFFVALNVIPTLWMIGMSFYNYSLMSAAPPIFLGADNFVKIDRKSVV